MIQAFTELTEDLKIRGIKPGFHFMDKESPKGLKMTVPTMNIKYQLVPQVITEQTMQRDKFRASKTTS